MSNKPVKIIGGIDKVEKRNLCLYVQVMRILRSIPVFFYKASKNSKAVDMVEYKDLEDALEKIKKVFECPTYKG